MRIARSRYACSRYFSQVSAGSSTWPSASTTGALTEVVIDVSLRGREGVVAEPLAQGELVDLAGRGHRHLRDEDDVVRQPPARDFRAQELEQDRAVELAARLARDDQQRALLPFRMEGADDRRLHHVGVPVRRVLQRDRADPFAAGLDEVLRSVD